VSVRPDLTWPEGGVTRVPYRVYSDHEIYAREQARIFRGPVWNFLCLALEIPNPGDFKTTFVGETPVIVTRDGDGGVNAMVNRCAHKGALVCHEQRGNVKSLTCIYHAWAYDLKGNLKGLAFKEGLRGQGGMPEDFDVSQHRLESLAVTTFCGLVFGTFSPDVAPIEDYLGPVIAGNIRRVLGRPTKLLGFQSQMINNNWKLYAENIRDSYHATVLHTFYTAFKVNRLDMDGGIDVSEHGWHHMSFAKRESWVKDDQYDGESIHASKYDSRLKGPALLEAWPEFPDGITHCIQSVFPTLGVQMTLNSLAVRFFVPRGIDRTELFWMYLGYEDDEEWMTRIRVNQSNLTGAAGYVSLEDGCIDEFVQRGTRGSPHQAAFMEMGGRDVAPSEGSRATETALRGFWSAYRELMDV